MNNQLLLKIPIETIKELRTEIHDDIDDSKRKKLDQIIKDLECCNAKELSKDQILKLFGKAINLIPALTKILMFWDKL